MFGPRHTLESVTRELVDGFEEGTVVLRPEDLPDVDIEDFESRMRTSLARYRRREIAVLSLSMLAAIASIGIAVVQLLLHPESQTHTKDPHTLWVALLGCIVGALMGFAFGYKSRERSVELKTFIRLLKLADPSTARRLAIREGPRLRERQLVP